MEHPRMVAMLCKSGQEIAETITPEKAHLLHMVLGISGEAGELVDQVKKHVIYNKELDLDNMIEELGDLEFYLEGLRQGLLIVRNEVLQANVDKLSVRYPGFQYSNRSAIERADKEG